MASSKEKWRISLLSGVIFGVIASPFLYDLTSTILGKITGGKFSLTTSSGCPSSLGVLVHAVVFLLITRLLMG